MALYELTVVKLSGETELRYTDRMPRVGGTVAIDGRAAHVLSRHGDATNPNALERFVCKMTAAVPRHRA